MASAQEVRKVGEVLFCGYDHAETIVLGHFTGDESAGRTRLILSASFRGCTIRHEDGPKVQLSHDYSTILGLCRDPVSDRDHAVLHGGGGTGCCPIGIWSVDPVDAAPIRLYSERWGSEVPLEAVDRWSLRHLIAEDGSCLWKSRAVRVAEEW